MDVRRHYVTVGTRQVHYRRAGMGPPILAFHSSPQTGAFVLPYLKDFAARFTIIAPDTPGYGGSDPLPQDYPTIEEYADASVETADALGLTRVIVYGTHTGAHIALEFARRHPQRVSLCILDGISFYTDDEQKEMKARYAPPFEPLADGGHLAWAWQHTRDQMLFYPWFRWEKERRLGNPMRDPAYIHQVVLWKMLPGWGYRKGYQAAFSHPTLTAARALSVPTLILAQASDILAPMASRITGVPPQVEVKVLPADKAPWLAAMNTVLDRTAPGMDTAPPVPAERQTSTGIQHGYVDHGSGQIFVRRRAGTGRPLLLLHGDMESSALLAPLMAALPAGRPLVALDLPGLGDSDPLAPGADLAAYRAAVEQVLRRLGIARCDLYARELAAPLALDLARAQPQAVAGVVFDQPVLAAPGERADPLAHYAPPLAPSWDGAYLMTAWHRLRDRALFWPWYRRDRAAVRWLDPALDAAELQLRLVETLKNPSSQGDYALAALGWTGEAPAGLRGHMLVSDKDPASAHARTVLEKAGLAVVPRQPADVAARAALIDRLLGPA